MASINLQNRTIFCRDNLDILRGINTGSIDLIYLDPPFNKKKEFTAPIGSSAEGASFKDWFREEDIKDEWVKDIKDDYDGLYKFLNGVKEYSNIMGGKTNKHYLYNYCYLTYMAIRLIEMQRILKDTGSIYLHCDPTMSHYIKLLMDIIFGEKNFRNEINWCYSGPSRNKKGFTKKHDILFFYSKTDKSKFNTQRIPHKSGIHGKGGLGFRGLETTKKKLTELEQMGKQLEDWWIDITPVGRMIKEVLGYPTQKPMALLERIIKASSNEGDIVLDPFCGCATTCVASEKLNRQWIGIDVSVKAYDLVKERLQREVADPEKLTEYKNEINFYTDPPQRTDTNGDDSQVKKHIYIISHPTYQKANLYKVGVASNIKSRLNSYQTGDPLREYKLEFELLTPYFREIEDYIHNNKFRFSHEWVNGKLEDIKKAIEEFDINEYNQDKGKLPLE